MSKSGGLVKIATLSTVILPVEKLKAWGWNNQYLTADMQRFIALNQNTLDYLGVNACIVDHNNKTALQLTTSQYVGAVPLFSPVDGTPFADLVVTGRFGEDVGDIISLLEDTFSPEYSDWLLTHESQMTPPIYLECCKFLDAYLDADRRQWRKFDNELKVETKPSGSTLWSEYALRVANNPLDFSRFKNKCNILTTNHPEWNQLNYVLKLAVEELTSAKVPKKTRVRYWEKINRLKNKLRNASIEYTTSVTQRISDPTYIKKLKVLANLILCQNASEQVAWRLNYSEFFERFVQYILDSVARKKGVNNICNAKYRIKNTSGYPAWGLRYLEPDAVLHSQGKQIIVDAKYKSHIYNWDHGTEDLKDTFRHDLHQILAYCSFSTNTDKEALLVYPYTDFTARLLKIKNPYTHVENSVYLVGIPIDRKRIPEIEEELGKIILFGD